MRVSVFFTLLVSLVVGEKKPLTPTDFISFPRNSIQTVSPDGTTALYSTTIYNPNINKNSRNFFLLDIASGSSKNVTGLIPAGFNTPSWIDNSNLGFFAVKDKKIQFFSFQFEKEIAKPVQLTNFTEDINNYKYHVASKLLTYTTDFELEKKPETFDSALAYDQLYVRHWDTFKDYNVFSHLNAVSIGKDLATKGVDLMTKTPKASTPIDPFGDAGDYAISPDGKEAVFMTRPDRKDIAWKATLELYQVLTDGSAAPAKINDNGLGAVASPRYSPDGKYIAWLEITSQINESGRYHIVLWDRATKKKQYLKEEWNLNPSSVAWAHDSKTLFLTAEHHARTKIFSLCIEGKDLKELTSNGVSGIFDIRKDQILFKQTDSTHLSELYSMSLDGSNVKKLSDLNSKLLNQYHTSQPEFFWFKGAREELVHGFILKPINYQEGKKYPIALWIHGGPEGSFTDAFGFGWNPQFPANAGYATVIINFHGSTGYGQNFTESILGNWGSLPYEDIMKGFDYALTKYDYLDGNRACAWGASYGGYTMNWLNGHTDRFKCLINHDGVFDLKHAYYTTDEVYFMESEFQGTPWDNPEGYSKYNPSNFVKNWKTPTLVIHGGKDYRLVDGEGLATFTALQRQGVPSRFLYFPTENHWTLDQANQIRWLTEMIKWANKWTNNTSPYKI